MTLLSYCDRSWLDVLKELEGDAADAEAIERIRLCFILQSGVYSDLEEARSWIRNLEKAMEMAVRKLRAKGVLLPKEMKSFINDPLHHLAKKLFIYTHDLVKGKLTVEDYARTSLAAIRTSIRTNMRSIYEAWVLLSLLALVAEPGSSLVYPEHGYLLIERSGRQRGGNIPPNAVVHIPGRGMLSFYLEAPRPISWGDTRDLERAWKLYVALRPDMMIYSGMVTDIVRLESNPPIERPNMIIEVKELPDWYTRSRELRGPFAKSMTAEEWRDRWIRGLWAGLADVLGVESPEAAYEKARQRRGLRLTEPQIVVLYSRIYKPDTLVLVSRAPVPGEVRRVLEENNVNVIDGVGFSTEHLAPLADRLLRLASYRGVNSVPLYLPPNVAKRLNELASGLGLAPARLVEALVELAAAGKCDGIGEMLRRHALAEGDRPNREGV